jgi:hypothetical protein
MTQAAAFDPWTATDTEAIVATLQQGHDPMLVALVEGRSSRLAEQLLPRCAPLRRWCVAGRVLQLREAGEATVGLAELQRAHVLCLVHDLAPPRWLSVALALRAESGPVPSPSARTAKALRYARAGRKVWELVRRFRWAHRGEPDAHLWAALKACPHLGEGLELEVDRAIRRLGLKPSQARQRLNEAQAAYGAPSWPGSAPPPMTRWPVKGLPQKPREDRQAHP